ncbi:MAG: 2-dehydropantoate 2-reductase, partial [Acetobacteraceae bacterium]
MPASARGGPWGEGRRRPLRICIFGAGAIGGYLAALLWKAGHEVCAITRGPHLQAIRKTGLKLIASGTEFTATIRASDGPSGFGPQDVVVCALKAHQAYESAGQIVPLLGPDTSVVTAMNGIPWWYFYKDKSTIGEHHLRSVDPDARQWNLIGPQRAIGCVVDPACEVVAPGVIEHHEFNRFILGEPDGQRSARVIALASAMVDAGLDAPIRDDIRWSVWLKLWGNVCFNPISALTRTTLDRIATEPSLRAVCRAMMYEAKAVADALNVTIPENMIDRRLAAVASVPHKMSMLQDLERSRSLEIDALVTAVQELGQLCGVPTPTIDLALGLIQELGRRTGLY